MNIKNIWITSEEHLKKFSDIISKTHLDTKIIKLCKIPKDFPKVRIYYFLKFPIVFFSKGEITLTENLFEYKAIKNNIRFLKSYSNLNNELNFRLEYLKVKSIEWYQCPDYFIKYYNNKWIKVICNDEVLGGSFLMCVGGIGPSMQGIIKNTDELFKMLNDNCNKY
ncbi:hypothetical protein [Candidatus Clostridium radicumherbarum]|uniref:Uncharacterized protein n=1 Tax=Candidatus Clostridium radicumherbarum TaxID=3381662 RepID=A0ABW8TNW2_9CLOT